jgi:hypothetical protein
MIFLTLLNKHCKFATRQPDSKFPAGQTTGLREYAYAFLCSTTLSIENWNLLAGRKPEHVNEALAPHTGHCFPHD